MSGNSIVIEREGFKEFMPALDETVYKKGSIGNKTLHQRLMRKEQLEKISAAAKVCTELVNKN